MIVSLYEWLQSVAVKRFVFFFVDTQSIRSIPRGIYRNKLEARVEYLNLGLLRSCIYVKSQLYVHIYRDNCMQRLYKNQVYGTFEKGAIITAVLLFFFFPPLSNFTRKIIFPIQMLKYGNISISIFFFISPYLSLCFLTCIQYDRVPSMIGQHCFNSSIPLGVIKE